MVISSLMIKKLIDFGVAVDSNELCEEPVVPETPEEPKTPEPVEEVKSLPFTSGDNTKAFAIVASLVAGLASAGSVIVKTAFSKQL